MPRVSAQTMEATRARLLAAAASEFGRVGLERANVDAIALAAGVAKGTLYNYFASKEDLFLAVVEDASAEAAHSGASPPGASARERLAATLAGFCAWAHQHEAFAKVLVRECLMGTPGLYPRVILGEAPLVGQLKAILREGAHRGELRKDVPADLVALAIAGLTDLALVQHWASDGTDQIWRRSPSWSFHSCWEDRAAGRGGRKDPVTLRASTHPGRYPFMEGSRMSELSAWLVLLALATTVNGLIAGASMDQSIEQLPARHRIGMRAYRSAGPPTWRTDDFG